jgi:hypothetical protein
VALFLTFEARSIEKTGRCSRDPGGRTRAYQVAKPSEGPIGAKVKCPVCGAEWPKFTRIELMSTLPPSAYVSALRRLRRPGAIQDPVENIAGLAEVLKEYRAQAGTQKTGNESPTLGRDRSEMLKRYLARPAEPLPGKESPTPGRDRSETLKDYQLPSRKQAPREIDLSRCRVTGLIRMPEVETIFLVERKQYPNNSKTAILTKEISISNSVIRTVTLEWSSLKAHNAEAGITLLGFAAIQGQVQQQLNQRYSVTTQSSIVIGEKTTIQIPPATTVEHVIRWKLVSSQGLAVLGESARGTPRFDLAQVPYQVPMRLTYDEDLNDVAPPQKGGR